MSRIFVSTFQLLKVNALDFKNPVQSEDSVFFPLPGVPFSYFELWSFTRHNVSCSFERYYVKGMICLGKMFQFNFLIFFCNEIHGDNGIGVVVPLGFELCSWSDDI